MVWFNSTTGRAVDIQRLRHRANKRHYDPSYRTLIRLTSGKDDYVLEHVATVMKSIAQSSKSRPKNLLSDDLVVIACWALICS